MTQFARPIADVTRTNWEEDDGVTTNIFDQIDEASADDNDYIRTILAPSTAIYVCQLGAVVDPVASTGHVVRFRYRKDADAGDVLDLTVQLRQGYVSEGTPGTLIAQSALTAIGGTAWIDGVLTLSAGEADNITDYSDLFLRMVGNTQ